MQRPVVSARGVYYDLSQSPYEYETPYGDIFKFPSAKKLEIYTRVIVDELDRLANVLERHEVSKLLPDDIIDGLHRAVYRAVYHKMCRKKEE